ncbi:dihydrolipoyl dehydrogenase [Litoreibacter sp.]|nr:dihydrolipoyl dehydrogenase [Litoreibacter sp.]
MEEISCKLLVLGAGPGGYVCAIRAGQLGVDTVIVEQYAPGGTCLNVGCIPSKALIHAADEFHNLTRAATGRHLGLMCENPSIDLAKSIAWKDGIVKGLTGGVSGLLKKAKVKQLIGTARIIDGKTVEVDGKDGPVRVRTEHLVIATGATPVELPQLPFGGQVISSTEALSLSSVPDRLAVVGGGYIGLEIGTAYAKMGAQVTIIEMQDRILPLYDKELTAPVVKRMADLGINVLTSTRVEGHSKHGLDLKSPEDGEEEVLNADKILVTVGRRPNISGFGLEGLGLTMAGPSISIDLSCRTSMRGVFAIGDVTGEPMLAHRAMAQGDMVAETVAGEKRAWDKRCIPAVCFSDPEIVTCGLLPEEAGPGSDVASFPFKANGKALTSEAGDGFVRIVFDKKDHVVLGIQAVGAGISEFSAVFAATIEMCGRLEDIAGTIHAHPTQSEAFQEAALKGLGAALHM